jgi:DNA-binding transcriptional LysR family regulator
VRTDGFGSRCCRSLLIPRLGKFLQRHPNVDLAIESSHHNVNFDLEAFDAGIRVGDGVFDGLVAHHLVDIATTPILAPSLTRRLQLRAARDLRRATLIHVTTYPIAWPSSLKQAGEPELRPARTISVDSFVAAMQAAERGIGVAFGLEPLITERERVGAICRPLPLALPTGSYWLVYPQSARRNRPLQAFKSWLQSELATG